MDLQAGYQAHQATQITSLPSVLVTLRQTWTLYKRRLAVFLGVMIVPILILGALLSLLSLLSVGAVLGFLRLSSELTAAKAIFFALISIATLAATSISQAWGQTALLYAIKDSEERIGVIEAYRRGWRKILSYWKIFFLSTLITFSGVFLFIIPGILFFVWFSLAFYVLVAENMGGMSALLKSREYVRGRWFATLLRVIAAFAPLFVIQWALSLIFRQIGLPFGGEIGSIVTGIFLTPFAITYMFFVYKALREEKGEFTFSPSRKRKAAFAAVGVFGILLLLLPFLIFQLFIPSRLSSLEVSLRDAARRSGMNTIQNALEVYYFDNGQYPFSLDELAPEYMQEIPVDPTTSTPYQYQRQGSSNYQLCVQLETTSERECVSSATTPPPPTP